MSDHIEHKCSKCGSLLHHADDCAQQPNQPVVELKPCPFSDKDLLDWLNLDQCWKGVITNPTSDPRAKDVRTSMKLRIEEFITEGRPHGSNSTYPDGCECELCELWDRLNKKWNTRV